VGKLEHCRLVLKNPAAHRESQPQLESDSHPQPYQARNR
jgi:hypothetical protein